ncbi:helix-turn-helix transcriptional regulator [Micromonospora endophytica]|uniref:AraC family transcriptional regulator n=1 Tax=Micromonospora endophytica TaxID=515350 RepID=A0A2W2CVM6_9ACTN|nr:helix-turn-helix transcriptional regulator [Micromonospora endophytica]PZF92409.1 AraC family transcriptional regulator [Micromonospora endophytica]RIW44800.1 AraC family transcriptional regulator [Micromonospora endophytica]BCJ57521.1 hypothetical protein Jiend_09430 [Micromonospora endophytica]
MWISIGGNLRRHRLAEANPPVVVRGAEPYGTDFMIRAAEGYRLRHHRVHAGTFWLETVAAAPGLPFSARWPPGKIAGCLLDLSVLHKVTGGAPDDRAGATRFTGLTPISPGLARLWRHTTGYLNHVVLGNPSAHRQPLVLANAARMLAAAALAVFPNTTAGWPTATQRRDATTATLRRATAFIEEHADRDIGAADIAAAAQVSLRALQLAFRRHLDTTPMAHLRRVRLDRAHHELLQADPRQETVSAIASRWGFLSHSRFTARYHAIYGIPPSRTLHA